MSQRTTKMRRMPQMPTTTVMAGYRSSVVGLRFSVVGFWRARVIIPRIRLRTDSCWLIATKKLGPHRVRPRAVYSACFQLLKEPAPCQWPEHICGISVATRSPAPSTYGGGGATFRPGVVPSRLLPPMLASLLTKAATTSILQIEPTKSNRILWERYSP